MNNRLPDRGTSGRNITKKEPYNFTKQLLLYAALSAVFALLLIGAKVVNYGFASTEQLVLFVNITMGMGLLVYMNVMEHKLNSSTKIYDNKAMYIICLLFAVMILSNFHSINLSWEENQAANIWLLIEAIFIAIAEESVFRGFGDFIFLEKGKREEAAMVICYAGFSLYNFVDGTMTGIVAFIGAVGIGTLMTGMYLRYRKIGANIAFHFILYYLYNVTSINSSTDTTLFGGASNIVYVVAAIGMVWYGLKLMEDFNRDGVQSEETLIKKAKASEFNKVYEQSKEKYKEKIISKAEPKIEANIEHYHEKQERKQEKKLAKSNEKASKEDSKKGRK